MRKSNYIVILFLLITLLPSLSAAKNLSSSEFAKNETEWLETLNSFNKGEPLYILWLAKVAGFYSHTEHDALAEPYLQQAISGAEEWLSQQSELITSDEQRYFAKMHRSLAMTFTRQERMAEAASSLQKRLDFLLASSERYESDIIQAKQDLAVNYTLRNDFNRAEPLFEEALELLGISIEQSSYKNEVEPNNQMNNIFKALQGINELRARRVMHNYLQMRARRNATESCNSRFNHPRDSIYQMGYILPILDCD